MTIRMLLAITLMAAAVAGTRAEPLAVVVAADSHIRVDRIEQLTEIYLKKRQFWPDGQRIVPVNLPAMDSRRLRFSQIVLDITPEQLDAYWNERYFHGVLPPEVLNSVEAVLRFVSGTRGAIGYVPFCNLDRRVVPIFLLDSEKTTQYTCPHEQPAR